MKYAVRKSRLISIVCLLLVSGVALIAQGCKQEETEGEKTAIPFSEEKAKAATPPAAFTDAQAASAQQGITAAQKGSEDFKNYVKTHPGQ